MGKNSEKKNIAKSKIIEYMMNHDFTSKVEIAKSLNISMPTVLTNVNDLIEKGLVIEIGEYESTGGRKAKSIGLNKDYSYSMGIGITAGHISFVLINMHSEIVKIQRIKKQFTSDMMYCDELAKLTQEFLSELKEKERILGIGISIPGIINHKDKVVIKSHALQIENYSLNFMEQMLPYPVFFENDANAAMMAENPLKLKNAIYLSLNYTLGGSFCIGGNLFSGEQHKAGEFGHMILVPGGKKCYCGKVGCADAYCAGSVLTNQNEITLEQFTDLMKEGNQEALERWDDYLKHLAILISNLRMAFDMDIILGGDVGGILQDHMMQLGQKVLHYNGFDMNIGYLKNCTFRKEASAVGVAKKYFEDFTI